jgi:hypothetical protein
MSDKEKLSELISSKDYIESMKFFQLYCEKEEEN